MERILRGNLSRILIQTMDRKKFSKLDSARGDKNNHANIRNRIEVGDAVAHIYSPSSKYNI